MKHFLSLLGLLVILLAACQSNSPSPEATEAATETLRAVTPIATVALASASPSPTSTPTLVIPSATHSPTASETAVILATTSPTHTAISLSTPSISPTYAQIEHYWLQRPIAQEEGRSHWLDRTYPYGGTQFGTREVHLGVEFVNPRFTSVLAAATGIVYYAGDDLNQRFGPAFDYYGNLIILEHPFPSPDGLTVYSLYGHLQDINVQTGDSINVGDIIGQVGDAGIAIGPHLHFEVRLGTPTDFNSTRNPDLWIEPYPNSGTLVGRVVGVENPYEIVIFVRSEGQQREIYTYGSDAVNSDPMWGENFTMGDLPEGNYELIISNRSGRNYYRQPISIIAGVTSWIEIDLSGTGYAGF